MLDDRKAAILIAVVEEYIRTAQPVGSSHVLSLSGLNVSPATVRNDMAALEREGYLVAPHTSAGRIPTDIGYRFYVDRLTMVPEEGSIQLAVPQRRQVNEFFERAHGELEEVLRETSQLLANLTQYAAVVVSPLHEGATVRSVQVVGLGDRVGLVVAVLSNGVVEKRTIEFPEPATNSDCADATIALQPLVGNALHSLAGVKPHGGNRIALAAMAALQSPDSDERAFVGGTARMVESFDAVETVRKVLGILEQQYVVVTLLRDVIDRGQSVAIGTEHGMVPLAECSLIVAPYQGEGRQAGTVAVLGPTRMDYSQAMSAVAVVSRQLGDRLRAG